MRWSVLLCLTVACQVLIPGEVCATHNRAGEIHIRQIGPLTIEATIITWTKASSINADRDTLTINWGDGKLQNIGRNNGNGKGVVFPNDIKYNTYVAVHTYAGPSRYRISMTDPNRNGGIVNVNPPSSDNVPFHIETIYIFQDPQFSGENTTPFLVQPPIDLACVGKPFKHNPNAYDPDGDSLSYHLIVPLQTAGVPVPNYSYPNQVAPGPLNALTLNERNGDILWDAPQAPGEYNLAFIVVSWRRGRAIDTTIRDMQILVEQCVNNPPVVQTISEICVVAGNTVSFPVTGNDPDLDRIRLTALGGPFNTKVSPAVFTAPAGYVSPPVTGTFTWQTTCEHIARYPYSVVFKATDTVSRVVPQLADLKTVAVQVVGPPPLDPQAQALGGVVTISWEKPYLCDQADEQYFYGFSVWRREGSNPFVPDSCSPGLAGRGYQELVFVTAQMENGRYIFRDPNVERGRTYCYRILGKFARLSAGGYRYNLVEGLPSEEVCVQLPRDLPLITEVSVDRTDPLDGVVAVRWIRPRAADLDTLLNPGPYRYQLLRATGFTGGVVQPVPGGTFDAPSYWQAVDTFFLDETGLNTQGQPHRYSVAFYVNGDVSSPLGFTPNAASVFLNIASSDRRNTLTWSEAVPWTNVAYAVFRWNPLLGQFDSIGLSTTNTYTDAGLVNGESYCYRVRSQGTYSIADVPDPLFNFSQEACGIPQDTVPPCVPQLVIENLCTGLVPNLPDPPFDNVLSWNNPNLSCPESADAVRYNLWFSTDPDDPLQLLARIDDASITRYTHVLPTDLAGCYAISAVDSVGNESSRSPIICVDNCPEYVLPNAFTPNGDEKNDFFTPFPGWRFVSRVDFQVFNRWGNLVFKASDPALMWDGRNLEGKEVSEGTYFYRCLVYERRVDGEVLRPDILSGYIELIRG